MRILLVGSGGREHAIAWKLSQSKKLDKLFIAPGNAGTREVGQNVDIGVNDFQTLGQFTLDNDIDFVVVGPEDPLVKGLHDFFLADQKLKDIPVIGPLKAGALLEGSKKFAKEFMIRHNIPTAKYFSVTKEKMDEGLNFLKTLNSPYVLKADGLAAGKGVLILDKIEDAEKELKAMFEGKFGSAGETVVIEEHLKGIELSVFVLTDGDGYVVLPEAKDYKRIGEGDTGLNTGGMGAISPVPFADKEFLDKVEKRIIIPTIEGLKKDNIPYKGFIFIGLMNMDGNPYVIEYNVRLGDPEAQVVLPRIKSDFVEVLGAAAFNKLKQLNIIPDERTATTVILVSGGYPGNYEKGKEISGLDKTSGSIIFHAGTKEQGGKVVTDGGRVIAVSSFGSNMKDALEISYKNAGIIEFDKKNYRKDIGFDL